MSILNEYNGGFHAPDIAINVNDVPEGNVPARSEAFKLSVLGAGKGVDGGCGYSMVEFQNNVSFCCDDDDDDDDVCGAG